jgi:hypothetical protein
MVASNRPGIHGNAQLATPGLSAGLASRRAYAPGGNRSQIARRSVIRAARRIAFSSMPRA